MKIPFLPGRKRKTAASSVPETDAPLLIEKVPSASEKEAPSLTDTDPEAAAKDNSAAAQEEPGIPATYREWMVCFTFLRSRPVTDDFLDRLEQGSCPGVEQVMAGFLDRLQDTVNSMLQRAVTRCTRSLNTCLEEGDLSNLELLLGRSHREMLRCRFYLRIRFLPPDFVRELDRQTLSETGRFWTELRGALADMAEETGNSDIYDILYYVDRLIKKDRQNGQL